MDLKTINSHKATPKCRQFGIRETDTYPYYYVRIRILRMISVECLGSCARRAVHIWIQPHMLAVVVILVATLSHACVVSIDSNITGTATQLAGLRLIPKQKG